MWRQRDSGFLSLVDMQAVVAKMPFLRMDAVLWHGAIEKSKRIMGKSWEGLG